MTTQYLTLSMSEGSIGAPAVSVIIPAYRVASVIPAALASVFDQTFRDFEVIVVNDGCPETTDLERAIEPYREQIRYLVQSNLGASGARNTGIRHARGEFVAFLDADDVLLPHFLEEHLSRARAEPDVDVFYGDLRIFGDVPESGKTTSELSGSSAPVTFLNLVQQRAQATLCSVVRRRSFHEHGTFDESLARSEDYDLWLRFARAGVKFNRTTRVVALHRRAGTGLSSDPLLMCRSMLAVLAKCRRTMRLSEVELEVLTQQERRLAGLIRFHEGKAAFLSQKFADASAALSEAYSLLGGTKLRVVVWLLHVCPGALWGVHQLRERRFYGARRPRDGVVESPL